MAYKVIRRFSEKHHNGHVYEVNKPYPAEGYKLTKSRAEELTKVHPFYGHAYLESVEEKVKPPKKANEKAGDAE